MSDILKSFSGSDASDPASMPDGTEAVRDGFELLDMNGDDEGDERSLSVRMREKLEIAEALAQASLLTSASAQRRLTARRLHMDAAAVAEDREGGICDEYVPPKQLLLYLVRMGSFNSTPKILNEDTQDVDTSLPEKISRQELLDFCGQQRLAGLPILKRHFDNRHSVENALGKKTFDSTLYGPSNLRVFQWNVLSQSLGQNNDSFVCCPPEALEWSYRKYALIEEIIQYEPDIICLQEVDHFNFLKTVLGTQGYTGVFVPKPDSPCMYIIDNNGPDGCAIFYKSDKLECLQSTSRILEVWRVQSNQVSIAMTLRMKETGKKICVATTHLKAKSGALLSKLRNEQGRDLLEFIFSLDNQNPTIICGDFNAEPNEPIYETIMTNNRKRLASAYASLTCVDDNDLTDPVKSAEQEPSYTTWKVREEGEVCHTIDYIFYTPNDFRVESILKCPTDKDVGPHRVPSLRYPSDHFSLVCDLCIT